MTGHNDDQRGPIGGGSDKRSEQEKAAVQAHASDEKDNPLSYPSPHDWYLVVIRNRHAREVV